MIHKIGLFLFDGYSDWEIAYLLPVIKSQKTCQLYPFSADGKAVESAGGLQTNLKLSMKDSIIHECDLLILPGGEAWEKNKLENINILIEEFHQRGAMIAAICGATLSLARMGILDDIPHTSNADFYLSSFCSSYKGQSLYQNQPSITEKNIITASGIAPVDFAAAILRTLQLLPENEIEKWYQLFKNGIWIE